MTRALRNRPRLTLRLVAIASCLVAAAACSEAIAPDPSGVMLEVVTSGLTQPVFITSAPGDPTRLYVAEKAGRIRVVRDGALATEPFLDITNLTSTNGERGLLGLAFDPGYAVNRHVFVNHTDMSGNTRILRFTATTDDLIDPGSLAVVLEIDQPAENHNGGHLAFGPDGMLYIGMGDGGGGGDPLGHGQNRRTLLGALLRIDVSTLPYTVPNNPFVGDTTAAPELFAYGLRNPWRFSFDRENGDLWIGDVGQAEVEEIDRTTIDGARGANFGWAITEGTRCYPSNPCDRTGLTLPILEYDHSDGCSVTGGYVYRGQAIPALVGRYFYADFCDGWVRSFRVSGGDATDHFDHTTDFGTVSNASSFGEDAAGELYVVSLSGVVYRVVPSAAP